MGIRPKNKLQIRVGSAHTEVSFFFFLLYFSVIGRYGNAESKIFFDVCGGLFFSYKHKAPEFVDTERLAETLLLMEGPRLVRLELNMAFGGVDAP